MRERQGGGEGGCGKAAGQGGRGKSPRAAQEGSVNCPTFD